MNLSDYIVIGLIFVFAAVGLKKGIVMSLFRVLSFFVSIYVSIRFSPVLAGILEKTPLYTWIKDFVIKKLLTMGAETSASSTSPLTGTAGAEAMIGSLALPGFLKKSMAGNLPGASSLIDMQGIIDAVGNEFTRMIMSVISLIALYLILNAVLAFAGIVLKGISKLPLLRQVDKLGGFVFGAVQGFLAVYILCAVLVLFNTSPQFAGVFKNLNESLFAGYFYENNFIMNRLFPGDY